MSKKDRAPDRVTHSSEFVLGHKLVVAKTVIKKGDRTYTGYGWNFDEADKNAGKRYDRGEHDNRRKP